MNQDAKLAILVTTRLVIQGPLSVILLFLLTGGIYWVGGQDPFASFLAWIIPLTIALTIANATILVIALLDSKRRLIPDRPLALSLITHTGLLTTAIIVIQPTSQQLLSAPFLRVLACLLVVDYLMLRTIGAVATPPRKTSR